MNNLITRSGSLIAFFISARSLKRLDSKRKYQTVRGCHINAQLRFVINQFTFPQIYSSGCNMLWSEEQAYQLFPYKLFYFVLLVT